MKDPKDFTNHSGGAPGSDIEWDRVGHEFGVTRHIHYRPSDLKRMSIHQHTEMLSDVKKAAEALGRPDNFKGIELVQRNWFQAEYAEAIFAVGRIVDAGGMAAKGYVNKTGHPIVDGGTGWAVQMGIHKGKGVAVYDMPTDMWYLWDSSFQLFLPIDYTPTLTKDFAGIGSRFITNKAWMAIRNVYEKTFSE